MNSTPTTATVATLTAADLRDVRLRAAEMIEATLEADEAGAERLMPADPERLAELARVLTRLAVEMAALAELRVADLHDRLGRFVAGGRP
jgi:hypothetical protein